MRKLADLAIITFDWLITHMGCSFEPLERKWE